MRERPDNLTDADLAGALCQHWLLDVADLRYAPVGYGGYHWTATDDAGGRWFATAVRVAGPDDLADLTATMNTARELADRGLGFVLAPLRTVTGAVVGRVGADYAITVFPFAADAPGHWAGQLTAADRAAVTGLLADLHRVDPVGLQAPVRPLNPPSRHTLEISLRERGVPWRGGPYSEAARALVSEHAAGLLAALAAFDQLTEQVTAANAPLVLTHGEPYPGNLIRRGDAYWLIDWDTAGLAVPERDLWSVLSDSGAEAALYADRAGRAVNPAAIELYRMRWDLDDAGLILADFRAPHESDEDTETGWAGLRSAIRNLAASTPA